MGTQFWGSIGGNGQRVRGHSAGRLGLAVVVVAASVLTAVGAASAPAGAVGAPILEGWGYNAWGQLGNGGSSDATTPQAISLPAGVAAVTVATGGYHSLAIGSDGILYSWGLNGSGQLGNGTTTNSSTPVVVQLPTNVHATSVAAGAYTSLAIGSDGRAYAWGDNAFGEVGNSTITAPYSSTPVQVSTPATGTIVAIAAGQYHDLAIRSNGNIFAWGYNNDGQLGIGTMTTTSTPTRVFLPAGVTARFIAGGGYHSLAVGSDGNTYSWGLGLHGELGNGTRNTSLSPGLVTMPVGVTSTNVAAGLYHSFAIGSDGHIYSWGQNAYGQLGTGLAGGTSLPALVNLPSGAHPSAVSAGLYYGLALLPDGSIYGWGLNGAGQLGNGTFVNQTSPVKVSFPFNATFTALASNSSSSHTLAIATPTKAPTSTLLTPSAVAPGYGQSETLTATVTGSTGGGSVNFLDGSNSLAGCGSVPLVASGPNYQAQCATSTLAAATHLVSAVYSGDPTSFGSSSAAVSVAVSPAPLAITGSSAPVTYGNAPPGITAQYSGFVSGDGPTSLSTLPTCSTTATSSSPVGHYPSSCSGASSTNYTITYADGEVVVAPAPLSITASNQASTYGATAPAVTPSFVGFVNGDDASKLTTQPVCSTTATASSSAGTYPSTCAGATDANYTISYTPGQTTVGAAPLFVTASSLGTTYGSATPSITPSYSGFLNGDNASSLTVKPSCVTAADSSSPVGNYRTSCSGATDPNYVIGYVDGVHAVAPAPLTVTASSDTMVYGAGVPNTSPSVAGLQNGEGASVLGNALTCSTGATSTSPVGTYSTSCSGASNPNYSITYVNGTDTINPAPLTVTASTGSMTYGGNVPLITATVNGLRNGESPSVITGSLQCSTTATATSPVGTYPSTCSGASDSNYAVDYVAGTVTDGPVPITVTASSGSESYGDSPVTINPTVSGLQNGEDVSVLGVGLMCTSSVLSTSPVGSYASMCAGGVDANYTISYAEGTVTVNQAPLRVTASSGTMTYGDSPLTVSPSVSGLVNGEAPSVLGGALSCSTSALASSAVGVYPSTCANATDTNYAISYAAGTITVDPAPLTIAASSAAVTYGDSPPTIVPHYTGFVNGDGPSSLSAPPICVTDATTSRPSGSYTSSCSGAADSNYTIGYVNGGVVVGRAVLVVVASDGNLQYGDSPSAVAPSYVGFINGDNASALTTLPTCRTSATSSSPVGVYATTCTGAAASNYTVTYIGGITTVAPAPLSITASSSSRSYGDSAPAVTPSYAGFVNGEGAVQLTTQPTCTSPVVPASPVGTYASNCSGASDSNYAITYVGGTVAVAPTPLSITASSGSQGYGSAAPNVTPSFVGFVNGENAAQLTTQPTCTSAVLPTSPVGSYSTSCTGASDSNYAITTVAGTVSVSPVSVTVTASSPTSTYGATVPTVTPTAAGLQNGEDISVLGAGLTCTTSATSSSPVGSYTSVCSGAVDANYSIGYVDGTVTESPALLSISASSGSFTYGDSPPAVTSTVSGLQNRETPAVLGSGLACATTAVSTSRVAGYPSSCSGAVDANYAITYVDGTVQVLAAPLSVAASSASMTYGGAPPAITPSYSGFVNGQGVSALTNPATCSTDATSNSAVGTYASTCSGASDSNYSVTYVPGNVVVGASVLVIAASSATKTYGDQPAAVSPSYSGFVNGDTPNSLTSRPTCASSVTGTSPVGTYVSSCSGASDPNYTIHYVGGSMNVIPAPLTIAASSATATYGGPAPVVVPSVSGFVNGDKLSDLGPGLACATVASPTSAVGSYSSTCVGASDANYTITYLSGTVQVVPAVLTVTAVNQSIVFGTAIPALGATFTGFVNGQTLATSGVTGQAVCTTTATSMSPSGSYPIACVPGTLHATNYRFTFVSGTLTIGATRTLACLTYGSVTVLAGQSVRIAPGCVVIGSITVNTGGALDSEGGVVLGSLVANGGSLRICNSSLALILSSTGASSPVVVGDGTSKCGGSTLVGGVSFTSNTGGVSLRQACAFAVIQVKGNSGGVTVTNNNVIGALIVTGNTGTVVDRPNTVYFGTSQLQ